MSRAVRIEVVPFSELSSGSAHRVEHAGRAIAVVRIEEQVFAIGDTCSHADVSLSEGEVICESFEIECWKHGSAFDLRTGIPMTLPATQPVPVYDAAVEGGMIVVYVSDGGATS